MPSLTFFRQARADGGIRTGVDVDGETVLEHFVETDREPDPALKWFVDLRCDGETLPDRSEDVRAWLLDHGALVTRAFQGLAKRLEVGVDPDSWPAQWELPDPPPGVRITTACSSIGVIPGREIHKTVGEIADHWREYLEQSQAAVY